MRGDCAPGVELEIVDDTERKELDFAGRFWDRYSEGSGKYDGRENNEYVDVRLLFKECVDGWLRFKECVDARLSFKEYTEEG